MSRFVELPELEPAGRAQLDPLAVAAGICDDLALRTPSDTTTPETWPEDWRYVLQQGAAALRALSIALGCLDAELAAVDMQQSQRSQTDRYIDLLDPGVAAELARALTDDAPR